MKIQSNLKKIDHEVKAEPKKEGCCQDDGVKSEKGGCCQEEIRGDDILDNRLIQDLFITNDVERIMIGEDFLVITKKNDAEWSIIKPEILSRIMDSHLSEEVIVGSKNQAEDDSPIAAVAIHLEGNFIVLVFGNLLRACQLHVVPILD
jgi:hypothetical protein